MVRGPLPIFANEPNAMSLPAIRVLPDHDRRLRAGSPWLYANELDMERAAARIEPGSVVRILLPDGKAFGLAHFNSHSLIAARLLARKKDGALPADFLPTRLARAKALRDQLFAEPFHRLVHAEADGLPGLIVDRYGDGLVAQLNTAGMERMREGLLDAFAKVLAPAWVVWRNDTAARLQEGLAQAVEIALGEPPATVLVPEAGALFGADVRHGQKTGWFYDHTPNRAWAERLATGRRVLDLYSHTGGFGLRAARGGAARVTLVDSSGPGLALARGSAERMGLLDRVELVDAEVFAALDALSADKRRFGLVIADPPAFVKARKDLKPGLKGYRKLARQAAGLVEERGFLLLACCSHHVDRAMFQAECFAGIREAGRSARLLHEAGAGPDHPVHPALPESAYLKFLVYALD